jgi:hypothetical protein
LLLYFTPAVVEFVAALALAGGEPSSDEELVNSVPLLVEGFFF